jgi:thiol-disulfide isomerase/thioredoxin
VDSLFADHGIPEEVQNRTDSSLFLLYFWGTWCHPCVKNMPKTNKLGQLAKGTDRLSMFGVALMSRGQVEQDIREFEKEYTLTFPSFVESFEAPHHFIRKLLNMRYPSYYLLNNKGRIIYKGENTPELWRALEKHGNIRKE